MIVVAIFFALLMYLVISLIAIVPVLFVARLTRKFQLEARLLCIVIASTLCLTPSLGPATITFVPVPFAFHLLIALLSGEWFELPQLVALFPIWHVLAFPLTALVSFFVARSVLAKNSLKTAVST